MQNNRHTQKSRNCSIGLYTRLLLESLYIKPSNYLLVKGPRTLVLVITYLLLVNAKRIGSCYCCYKRLSERLCIRFSAIARTMTRHFTCRAITWPFARLAIASFYVYGLIAVYTKPSNFLFGLLQHFYLNNLYILSNNLQVKGQGC